MSTTASRSGRRAVAPFRETEPRGLAPALFGMRRPGFIGTRLEPALLDYAGQPLIRRSRRLDPRLGSRLAGSGVAHLLILVLLALSYAQQQGGKIEEPSPVEMMYDHPGTSGMTGPTSKDVKTNPPPPRSEQQQKPPPTPRKVTPEKQTEETPPQPQTPSGEVVPQPVPLHSSKPTPPSPFAHPMDLSLSQEPSPSREQAHRASGSGAAIDLSLGPMVRDGKLLTPYASATGIKGVSDDYADELGAWIRRHMYYPEDAARRGEDGPSSVHVVIDRQGRVKSIHLVSTSGSFSLDDATQGMFRNAVLPPVPPDMIGDHFDVDLTIDYILIRK